MGTAPALLVGSSVFLGGLLATIIVALERERHALC